MTSDQILAWQLSHIERGIASIEAGRVVPHAEVRDWLRSWGTDDELPPPEIPNSPEHSSRD